MVFPGERSDREKHHAPVKRVLVKYGGAAIAEPGDRARLMADLRALHDQGHRVLVVHGAGPQMTALARRLGIEPAFRGGRRVTDEAMLEVVQMELAGRVSTDLLAAALGAGLPALNLPAAAAGLVVARRRPPRLVPGWPDPVDFGLVADIEAIDGGPLRTLWNGGLLPILSSLVCTAGGRLLNLNADTLVSGLVRALPFDELVYVADVPGVFADLEDPGSHLARIRVGELPGLIEGGAIRGGMIAKLDEISGLLGPGLPRVFIVGRDEPSPVSSAIAGRPGRRTLIHA